MRRVQVPGDRPYDVVIGPGAQSELGIVLAGTPKAVVIHAPPLAAAAGAAVETLQTAGIAAEAVVVPDGEAAKTAEVAARTWEEFGRLGMTRSDAVVGSAGERSPTSRVFWPPPGRAASASCRCRPACSAWSTPPWAARPGSTPAPARTWSAPSIRRLRCWPTPTRWPTSGGGVPLGARRGREVRVHRRRRHPRPARRRPDRAPGHRRADRARGAGEGRSRGRRPLRHRAAGVPQLRAHPRPRDRAGGGLRLAARRGGRRRPGVRRGARRAGRPARPAPRSTGTARSRRDGAAHPVHRRLGGCRR